MTANDNDLWARQIRATVATLMRDFYGNLRLPQKQRERFVRDISKRVRQELREAGCDTE